MKKTMTSTFDTIKKGDDAVGHHESYENDSYLIRFVYIGNYYSGSRELQYLAVDAKCKGPGIPVSYCPVSGQISREDVRLEMDGINPTLDEMPVFKDWLDNAMEAAEFMLSKTAELFPEYTHQPPCRELELD